MTANGEPGKPSLAEIGNSSPRTEYSFDEIQRMLGDIDGVVSRQKAMDKGVDRKNMVKTVRGGRVVWITVDEMNSILKKQRAMVKSAAKKPASRNEGAASSEIGRRVEACRELVSLIRSLSPDEASSLAAMARYLTGLYNNSIGIAREIRMIEDAIRRKKREDSLYRDMESASSRMIESLERNEFSGIDVNHSFIGRHMEDYSVKRKRLEPYLKKADQFRRDYFLLKRKIMLHEFDFVSAGASVLADLATDILFHDRRGDISEKLVPGISALADAVDEIRPAIEVLREYPDSEIVNHRESMGKLERERLAPMFHQIHEIVGIGRLAADLVKSKPDGA